MANEEQVKRLLAGVDEWNKWRRENLNIEIDLARADLRGARLMGAHLVRANLVWADLREADLRRAYLADTDLRRANLSGADLTKVYLKGATLKEASLGGTNLSIANLDETKWDRVWLEGTVFGNTDLSKAEGLEEVKHVGGSIIDTKTLQRSKGKIPEAFLRGCGLSDWEIESVKLYQPGLSAKEVNDIVYRIYDLRATQAIQYYSVFISYSTKDQEFAQHLHDDLQDHGVRCWFAPEDVKGGKKLHEQIDSAIRAHDRLLLVLSENSMNSEWVKTEIANARQKEMKEKRQVLFPISLVEFEKIREWKCFDADTGKDSGREIREYFIPDLSKWQDERAYRPAFEKLLKDLRAKEGAGDGE